MIKSPLLAILQPSSTSALPIYHIYIHMSELSAIPVVINAQLYTVEYLFVASPCLFGLQDHEGLCSLLKLP